LSESLGSIIVAVLTRDGQMTDEEIQSSIQCSELAVLNAELERLVNQGSIRRSPRKNYYVPGHCAPAPAVTQRVPRARSAAVQFGGSSGSGEGFAFDGRIVMPGDVLTNRELMDAFRVSSMGGIRISKTTNVIVLVTSVDNAVYQDRWKDGVFSYTGEGMKGDQAMAKGNLALANSASSGTPLLLFFKRKTNEYVFEGEVQLSAEPTVEQQQDETGLMRCVFMFPLKLV
jgi:hypothetical protein